MHNLQANFDKFEEIIKSAFGQAIDSHGNFQHYPRLPKASDCQILALALTAAALEIQSENLLFLKLKSDAPALFERLPDRCNFNRRRRLLFPYFDLLSFEISTQLLDGIDIYIADSMPLPICRLVRKNKLKILQDDPNFQPELGYLPIDRQCFYGFKIHLIIGENGAIAIYFISPANVHDITGLSTLAASLQAGNSILADKGYISEPIQTQLFEEEKVKVYTPSRRNQKTKTSWSKRLGRKRKRIETVFSQFCDQFAFKANYAKCISGYMARIITKITAFSCLQFINFLHERPLNQVRNALAS
jgi:hypothetical protein